MLNPIKYVWPPIRNYWKDDDVNTAVKKFIDTSIVSIESDSYHATLKNSAGYIMTVWTANKMYAFASNGKITDKYGKIIFRWEDSMASRITNWRLRKTISTFGKEIDFTS